MSPEQRYIIALSKAAIFDEDPPLPPEDIDWQYIWDKAYEQNISGLLASAILKLPKNKQPANAAQWRNIMIETMVIMTRKNAEFERMSAILKGNQIDPICLKGIVSKELYGSAKELRTMGDFDVLIEKNQRKTAGQIFEQEGYKVRNDTLFVEVSKGNINGELFESLEAELKHEPQKWDKILKNNVIYADGMRILNPTYEFAFSVIHTAKHLVGVGAGLRSILDAVLMLKHRKGIDFNKVNEACKAQGYERVLEYIITIAEEFYGLRIDADIERIDCEKLLEYMLDGGVFGYTKEDNVLIQQVAKQGGNSVGAIRRIFFPPREMLAYKYQYVKKSPVLLPVAWVHRFFTAVFLRHHSIKGMAANISESVKYSKEHDEKLKELGLI